MTPPSAEEPSLDPIPSQELRACTKCGKSAVDVDTGLCLGCTRVEASCICGMWQT